MKFLTTFCFYLLCLAIMPCHDGVECPEIKTEHSSHHQEHSSKNEQCPPFCTCACCGMQMSQVDFPVLFISLKATAFLPSVPSEYRQVFPDDPSKSIWQPPRIS